MLFTWSKQRFNARKIFKKIFPQYENNVLYAEKIKIFPDFHFAKKMHIVLSDEQICFLRGQNKDLMNGKFLKKFSSQYENHVL